MKKKRITKAKNQTYHFKKRCEERLNTQINRKDIQRRIKEQKYSDDFYFLDRQSNRVTRYRYRFQDKWYIIPYDKNTHKVVTIFEDYRQDPVQETAPEIVTQNNPPTWFEKIRDFIRTLFSKSA
jgi:hypothetical protein